MSDSINRTAWKLGWKPQAVIGGLAAIGLIFGFMLDALIPLVVLGLIAGIALWGWGVMEINNKYGKLLKDYRRGSRRSAENSLGMDTSTVYTLVRPFGDSPMFVEPSPQYSATHFLLTDVSVAVNEGSTFDMESIERSKGGRNKELYYDNIESVRSTEREGFHVLEINTAHDHITAGSADKSTVNQAESDLRQRMRETRRSSA